MCHRAIIASLSIVCLFAPTEPVLAQVNDILRGALTGALNSTIQSEINSTRLTTSTSTASPTREGNRQIQRALNQLGYSAGTADGILGRRSRAAVAQFQKSNGYSATGTLTNPQKSALLSNWRQPSSSVPFDSEDLFGIIGTGQMTLDNSDISTGQVRHETTTATTASDSVIRNVYDNLADIEAVKDNKDNIDVVAGDINDIGVVASLSTEVGRVGSLANMASITSAANPANLAKMDTAALIIEQGVLDVITTNLTTLQNAGAFAEDATQGAIAAAASEAGAALEATAALASKNSATASAATATTKAGEASASEVIATTKASEASASASAANASEGVAATHASTASNSKTGAQLAESGATVSMNTAISETATATTKAGEASTSAANALVSEGAASVSAATATTKASEASASEGVATTKASEAAVALATFQDQYYGALATPPTTNLDVGDIYFDTVENSMKVYSGTAWGNVAPVALSLLVSQISDLTASASELNYVDATSSIQTQLDAKADSASISSFLVDATTSASGLMSGADKTKLDGMTFTTGSSFPAVGSAGSLFFNTSDGALYLSTGSQWSHVGPSSATFALNGSTLTITS